MRMQRVREIIRYFKSQADSIGDVELRLLSRLLDEAHQLAHTPFGNEGVRQLGIQRREQSAAFDGKVARRVTDRDQKRIRPEGNDSIADRDFRRHSTMD